MKTTMQTEQRAKAEPRHEPGYVTPEVNIYETKDGYVVEAEMPGVHKDGLEITLEDYDITLLRPPQTTLVPCTPLFRERVLADYRRVFEIDPAIDAGKIAARMDQGVLTLTLPKSEEVKPRKIAVG